MEFLIRRLFLSKYRSKLFLFLVLNVLVRAGAFYLPESDCEITRDVISYIINNQYDSAFCKIDNCTFDNRKPHFLIIKVAAILMRDVDFEKTIDSSFFLDTYETAINAVKQWEEAYGVSSYSTMLSGMCRAFHSAFYLRQKKYLSALQNGLNSIKLFREAQKMDSTNYEVDFFLGLYEFGLAELRSRYWWILFWYPGDRRSGIERMRRCAEKAIITAEAAQISLCDFFTYEKEFKDAEIRIGRLKKKYPFSRFVLWAEAKYFERTENYADAALIYSSLAGSYGQEKYGDYNYFYTSNRQAQMFYKAGNREGAANICKKILENKKIKMYKEIEQDTRKLWERCYVGNN